MEEATNRRLLDELNIEAELEFVYKFAYEASYGELGAENELCWVYLGRTEGEIAPNRNEIADARFLGAAELEHELDTKPERFTPWFKLEWRQLNASHAAVLAKYLNGEG